MSGIFHVGRSDKNITATHLKSWRVESLTGLASELSKPIITSDKLAAGYFLRCSATKRNNVDVSDTANLLILDGDSRFNVDNQIINGAPDPFLVHQVLRGLNLNHIIYTSFSNNPPDVHKYRVILPCKYHRSQLDGLLAWIFAQLHAEEVNLVDVKENHSYAQAWFLPSCPVDKSHLFKTYAYINGAACVVADYTPNLPEVKQAAHNGTQRHKPQLDGASKLNPIREFNRNHSIYEVLTAAGYVKKGAKRWLHPNSQSGIAGVRVLENGQVYSDSNDVLNDGKSHDAFDCHRLLFCAGDMREALNWNQEITQANRRNYYAK